MVHHAAEEDKRTIRDEDFPLTYDGAALEAYWAQHMGVVFNRVGEVALSSVPFCCKIAAIYLKNYIFPASGEEYEQRKAEEQRALAIQLRELLVALGPAFVKLGQVLSTRPDFFPGPVLHELQALCDSVPSFPTPQALEVIERELGRPVESMFVGLDKNSVPVAAASLGQVYRCQLRREGSDRLVDVALKVQRPDMIQAVSLDLYVMRHFMHYLENVEGFLMQVGILAERKQFNLNMFDGFAAASYSEVDYEHEASNQETFARKLAAIGMDKVYIPAVYREGTRRRVLSTEWISGEQLSKSDPAVIRELITTGVECFLGQLLEMGFFHGDPHAGNLLVNEKGQLVLIDFGLCAVVDMPSTVVLTASLVHLMRGNTAELINDMIKLGFLPDDVDKSALLPILDSIFTKARLARAAAGTAGFQSHTRGLQFQAVSRQLNEVFFEFPFVVPEYFALVTRALIVLEGIAVIGDPSFDIFSASYPYAAKRAMRFF
ncbi:unnamed protein product [Ectocarpus fasciculatus]